MVMDGLVASWYQGLLLLLSCYSLCMNSIFKFTSWPSMAAGVPTIISAVQGARMKKHSLPLPLMSPQLELRDLPGLATKQTEMYDFS